MNTCEAITEATRNARAARTATMNLCTALYVALDKSIALAGLQPLPEDSVESIHKGIIDLQIDLTYADYEDINDEAVTAGLDKLVDEWRNFLASEAQAVD